MALPRLAFFGATGGCAGSALAHALKNGHDCIALARTPSKLTTALKSKGIDTSNLQIIQGDAKNVEDVKKALVFKDSVVDIIISGVGSTPQLRLSWIPMGLADPTVCEDAMKVLLLALAQLSRGQKPRLINLSTTGLGGPKATRDVPLGYGYLYHWLLHEPHEDKRKVQELLRAEMRKPESQQVLGVYTTVMSTLLVDGKGLGIGRVREGWEGEPAVGYSIRREDVGEWVFERLVREEVREVWRNAGATITS
ncbi:hypothetical protein MBLNU230_g5874t1 [Neophaeotheca triangularis]